MIKLENLSVILNERIILHSLDFAWNRGETVALVGANGAGKSTLLKVMSTLIKPTAGKLVFTDEVTPERWRRMFAAVFQESFLYNELSAQENLFFYQRLYGKADPKKVDHLLQQVNLLKVKHEKYTTFSKGMKQRLAIARALIHEPDCLLLDEPFDGLDLTSKVMIEDVLNERKKKGVGWVLVSHDLHDAWRLCDRVVLLHHGTIHSDQACKEREFESFLTQYKIILKEDDHGVF